MTHYIGQTNDPHADSSKTGILLVNLGTPDAPSSKALRKYLAEFLSDPRVIEIPRIIWLGILYGLILPFRAKRSAHAYQKIWTAEGSPLRVLSTQLKQQLEIQLNKNYPNKIGISLGMRYGNPSIATALSELHKQNINRLIVLPLYPQYAASSVGSAFDAVVDVLKTWRRVPAIHFIDQYADHPMYIKALARSIEEHWQKFGKPEQLLFSFHGLPKRSLALGDPYYHYCQQSARLVAETLNLSSEQYQIVFQSRFGLAEWLKPYCSETLRELPKKGIKNIQIICPGFAVDCLETLEEIAIQNRQLFLTAGGEQFSYIPALNTQSLHIELLNQLICEHLKP